MFGVFKALNDMSSFITRKVGENIPMSVKLVRKEIKEYKHDIKQLKKKLKDTKKKKKRKEIKNKILQATLTLEYYEDALVKLTGHRTT